MNRVKTVILLASFLYAAILCSAETLSGCSIYQADIDYWQQEYLKKVKKNKELYKELMESKLYILENGIKIPDITLGEVSIPKPPKKKVQRSSRWYD